MERRGTPIRWMPYDLNDADFVDEVARIAASLPQ